MKLTHHILLLLTVLAFSGCKKISMEQLTVSGKIIHPLTSETYANVEVYLMRSVSKGNNEMITATRSNAEGFYSFDLNVTTGNYYLDIPSLDGSWKDENQNNQCNSNITPATSILNYHVSRGVGSVQFEIERIHESQIVSDVEINIDYPLAIPGTQLTQIYLYSIELLENFKISAPTGEATIHLKYKIDHQWEEQWIDVTILKNELIVVPVII